MPAQRELPGWTTHVASRGEAIESHKARICRCAAGITGATFALYARYLGAIVGPEAASIWWKRPAQVQVERTRWLRAQVGVCTSRAVVAYRQYALSHVLFHAQFTKLPDAVRAVERRCIAITFAAPYNAYTPEVVAGLDLVGLVPFPDLFTHCMAALMRHAVDCPILAGLGRRLEAVRDSDDALLNPRVFRAWFDSSILADNLWAESRGLCYICRTNEGIVLPAGGATEFKTHKLQRALVTWMRSSELSGARTLLEAHITRRLRLHGFGGVQRADAGALIDKIKDAARLVPPRCLHAGLRTTVNAWVTRARFGNDAPCLFCETMLPADNLHGHPHAVRDDLRHFCCCLALLRLAGSLFCSHSNAQYHMTRSNFFLIGLGTVQDVARHLVWLDVVYRIHCVIKNEHGRRNYDDLSELARARLRQALTFSAKTRRFIEGEFRFTHKKRRISG